MPVRVEAALVNGLSRPENAGREVVPDDERRADEEIAVALLANTACQRAIARQRRHHLEQPGDRTNIRPEMPLRREDDELQRLVYEQQRHEADDRRELIVLQDEMPAIADLIVEQ